MVWYSFLPLVLLNLSRLILSPTSPYQLLVSSNTANSSTNACFFLSPSSVKAPEKKKKHIYIHRDFVHPVFESVVWQILNSKSRLLTWFADEQGTNESRVDISDCVYLGGVGVSEAFWITAGGPVFRIDVPHVLVITSWRYSIIILLLTSCGVIIAGSWRGKKYKVFESIWGGSD